MDLRVCALAEIRKGSGMSKAPDLSAFPIPRKGGAKPIVDDERDGARQTPGEGVGPEDSLATLAAAPEPEVRPRTSGGTKGGFGPPSTVSPAQLSRPPSQ